MNEAKTGDNGADQRLRAYVERIERINAEIDERNNDKREIYQEVKSNGFDTKALKWVVAERRKDKDKRAEEADIRDMYWRAVHGGAA